MIGRRTFMRMAGAAGLALVVGAGLEIGSVSAAESEYQTITALNLRAKPSSKGKVMLVMPAGSVVANLGYAKNGYINVEYAGTAGWAKASYLGPVDPAYYPPLTGWGVTTSSVNLRQGPSTGDAVLRVVPADTEIETSASVVDGFRFVRVDGQTGWIFDTYIS